VSLPATIGVIGGGTMGAGIAQTFAAAGSSVVVLERDPASMAAAEQRIGAELERWARRDPEIDPRTVGARITVAREFAILSEAGLVVEAVPELRAAKSDALGRAELAMTGSAWLATNTSSLPVTDLALELERPERFFGLHFFNPVPASALVEIVVAPTTSQELLHLADSWVRAIGKTPITVRDSPGFASSRLGLALALEAMRMLQDGVASAEDIDTAMVLGYRHAMGPLRTTDLVGLDVRLGIAEHLESTLGSRFTPPRILRDLVADGSLGRKAGRGFFDYPPGRHDSTTPRPKD
jgi:3-hydroxybutyryl-CoA dehydrogenase